MRPEITVIVPVYNGEKTLSLCLDSLMALDYPKEELEIIVVDNDSTDESGRIIQRYLVKYVFEKKLGRARARNTGIKAAKGDYIAFTDADCIIDKNWLKELIKGFTSDDVVACGGKILASDTKNWIAKYIEETGMLAQEGTFNDDTGRDIYRIVTANAIFRKNIFEKLGYFDERLITGEDTEMGYRIALHGDRMIYMPGAVVYHQHIKRLKKFCLWNFEFGLASYIYYQKYQKVFVYPSGWQYFLQAIFTLLRLYGRYIQKLMKKEDKFHIIFLESLTHTFYMGGQICGCLKDILTGRFNIPEQTKVPLLNSDIKRQIGFNYNGCRWLINKAIFGVPEGETIILFHSDKNIYFKLEEAAVSIWKSFMTNQRIPEIIRELSQKYELPENEAERDLISFIKQLEEENIIMKY